MRGVVAFISAATVWRTLRSDAIRPWFHRSWIFPRDPDFAAKAAVFLDLYARLFDGKRLGRREYVISSDEKTSIQARCRCHPSLSPGKARLMRVEHELTVMSLDPTGRGRQRWSNRWKAALNAFSVPFEGRL